MKTQKEPINQQLQQTIYTYLEDAKDALFFDIESTGLSPKNASVYLIGAVCLEPDGWNLRQWFAQDPSEEKAVLEAFLSFAKGFGKLVHFNGSSFDIPFLQSRCKKHGLASPLAEMEQLDIYRQISACKNALKLSNCKQKTLEEFLGLFRSDPFTGGELIAVYDAYRSMQDERLLQTLLLHNADDLRGMLSILPMLSYTALFSGHFRKARAEVSLYKDYAGRMQKELLIRLHLLRPLAKPLALHAGGCYFSGKESDGLLKVPILCGELKHFYPDYKNYSYLPEEDNAIHKSVAIYVDKAHRVPATPKTCYTRREGEFLPLLGLSDSAAKEALFSPLFSRSPLPGRKGAAPCRSAKTPSPSRTKPAQAAPLQYFLLDDALTPDSSRLSAYAAQLLSFLQKS